MKFDVPRVDYKDLCDESKRKDIAAFVVKNLAEIGFIYVTNVKDYDWKSSLSATKWFFKQPLEQKMQVALKPFKPENDNVYYGYTPEVIKTDFFVETFCIGPTDDDFKNLTASEREEAQMFAKSTPKIDCSAEGRKHYASMRNTYNAKEACSLLLMQVIAVGLGEKPDFFDDLFKPTTGSAMRYFFYPQKKKGDVDVNDIGEVVRLQGHKDVDILTLLDTYGEEGLEFKTKDGVWAEVTPLPGALLINIGETLSRLTGRKLLSVVHRVVDTGVDRYSAPFFLAPWFGVDISRDWHIKKDEECQEETPFIVFMLKLIIREKEYRDLRHYIKPSLLELIDRTEIGNAVLPGSD